MTHQPRHPLTFGQMDFESKNKISHRSIAVNKLILKLEDDHNLETIGDNTIDLSRHDYKICNKVLESEIYETGFSVECIKAFGPINDIGAMVVYVLKK